MWIFLEGVHVIKGRTLSNNLNIVFRERFVSLFLEKPITSKFKLVVYWYDVITASH